MMRNRYKPHLLKIMRSRTSVDRDMDEGLCLDRNERVSHFPDGVISDIFRHIPKYAFNAYPDPERFYKKLSGWLKVPASRIYVTNGVTEGMRVIFETLVSPGDQVIIISPTFPMYQIYSEIYQARVHNVGFQEDLSMDMKGLYNAVNDDTCLVCVPNPNLPVESVLDLPELKRLADKCKKHGAVLIVDEAYYFFGSQTAAGLIDEYDNVIILRSFSKAFGLAGARLGCIMSNDANIEYLSKTRSLVESNWLSMFVGEYMLDHSGIMEDYVKQTKEGAAYVKSELTRMGFKWFGGSVTNGLLIFLNDKAEVDDLLAALKKAKIYIRGSFGQPIENCARLTLGPRPAMEKFIVAFTRWADNHSKRGAKI